MGNRARIAVFVGVFVALVVSGLAWLRSEPIEYQEMSASGYLMRVQDGEGTDQFTITDAGAVSMAGSLNVDGATTLAALTSSGALDLNGQQLVLDADGDTIIQGVPDDVISVTIGTTNTAGLQVLVGNLSVGDGTPGTGLTGEDAYVEGTLEVDGVARFDGAGDFNSSVDIAGLLYPSFADETITDGETLTATVTVYNLDSGGAVTMTLAAVGTDGQLLILCGDDANNITVADTNVRTNDGNAQVIGQYDCITWVFIDSEWLERSESNNS